MTDSVPPESAPAAPAPLAPAGIRIPSTLCWLVGITTIGITIAIGIPEFGHSREATTFVILNGAAGVMVCLAGYLVRQRRRVGILLVFLAWAAPSIESVASGGGAQAGNLLLLVALVALLMNRKHLR